MIYILGKYRKNSRFLYFLANISRLCIPGLVYRLRRLWLLRPSNIEAAKHLKLRADYYCKLEAPCKLGVEASKFRFNLLVSTCVIGIVNFVFIIEWGIIRIYLMCQLLPRQG